ncbi:unnamed protein product [Hermetia illucens]|uniref:Uncharacterized protein n=2 Tax=Hermetia illucens TaxID=343691 RepID=A0A7R8YKN7_HERIL|nr:unnamed protein product [Hermetia illucens]
MVGQIDVPCRNWFLDALERCSDMVFLRPEPKVHTWLFDQVMNLRFYIFPRGETSITTNPPHIRMHPEMLTKSDCNHLFVEAAKDYIEIAPRYSMCLEDNLHYVTFLKALFGLFTIYLICLFLRSIFRRKWWRMPKVETFKRTPLTSEEETLERKMRWLNDRSLTRQKFEVNHFKIEKTNARKIYCDPPTIAIKVKKKHLSEALFSLVKTDPIVDEQRNGFSRSEVTKSRGYAIHKLNLFLNNKTYCRVVLDIGYEEDDSDSDPGTRFFKNGKNYSAGDQLCSQSRCKESTMDESADTSSASSIKYPCEYSRPRRYCSKYKHTYLQSIGWGERGTSSIPTYRDSLTRKDSSNSVSILLRKDSRILNRKASDMQRGSRSSTPSVSVEACIGSTRITKV